MSDFFVLQPDLSKKMREGGGNHGIPTNAAWVAARSPLVKTKSLLGSPLRPVARSDGGVRDEWLLRPAVRSAREDEGEGGSLAAAAHELPDLPDFLLSLKPDDYELPDIDRSWGSAKCEPQVQTLKAHLNDHDDKVEIK
ncbi:BRO1 domain-containing protein BROX [Cinnamomum micranthum f. kanehirae]|uniref:BRO1 domain-containing protein BROX n=1 Tax=Cinnamomum micranthum f. kanehirae TaxID=337451 RepID=A0A443NNG7_9MAGN|nr:BRO1 domain-containing protein BROX [Cinnamomum micranthum f. kanehirae]